MPQSGWTVDVLDERVVAELDAWPAELRARLTHIIERIEMVGLDRMGPPHVDHLRGKIWEMRPSGNKVEGRALYLAVSGKRAVIVRAFEKTTRKTPAREIDLAEERAKGIKNDHPVQSGEKAVVEGSGVRKGIRGRETGDANRISDRGSEKTRQAIAGTIGGTPAYEPIRGRSLGERTRKAVNKQSRKDR